MKYQINQFFSIMLINKNEIKIRQKKKRFCEVTDFKFYLHYYERKREYSLLFAITRNFYTNQMLITIYRSITKMIIDLGGF